MDTSANTLTIKASRFDHFARFLLHVAEVKGHHARFVETDGALRLHDRNLVVPGFHTSLLYLCERFPAPDLTPGDVVRRALIRTHADQILTAGEAPDELRTRGLNVDQRFLFGHEPTLIDIALITVTPANDALFAHLHRSFETASSESQRAALR